VGFIRLIDALYCVTGTATCVWIAVLKVFGYIWVTLGVVLILIGIAGTWMKGGFSAVQHLMSPFNVIIECQGKSLSDRP